MSKSNKVFFSPYKAIRYIGEKEQEFTRSLARPKPIVKNGDYCIVTKKDAYNLCRLFPTLWKQVDDGFLNLEILSLEDDIRFQAIQDEEQRLNFEIEELKEQLEELESENEELSVVAGKIDLEEDTLKKESNESNISKQNEVTIKAKNEFVEKDDLELYAKEFGIDLDKRATIDNMYKEFEKALVQKGITK